jgi:hypothetical protein
MQNINGVKMTSFQEIIKKGLAVLVLASIEKKWDWAIRS